MKTTLLCVALLLVGSVGSVAGYKIGLAENKDTNETNDRIIELLLPEVEVTMPPMETEPEATPILKRLPPVEEAPKPKKRTPIYVENIC